MLCFNIPRPIPTEVADTYFFQAQCLCWFSVFIFRPGHSTTKSQACFLSVSVLIWGGEPTGLQAKYCLWQNVVIENGLLTLCSRFAHALLTLCSRFAHARWGSFWVLTSNCPRSAHALLTLLTLWGGVYFDEETPPCHTFLFRTMCTLRHTAFRLQTPWGRISNLH